jgi:hypothetical protein
MKTSEKLKAIYFTSKLNLAPMKNVAYLSNIDHPLLLVVQDLEPSW